MKALASSLLIFAVLLSNINLHASVRSQPYQTYEQEDLVEGQMLIETVASAKALEMHATGDKKITFLIYGHDRCIYCLKLYDAFDKWADLDKVRVIKVNSKKLFIEIPNDLNDPTKGVRGYLPFKEVSGTPAYYIFGTTEEQRKIFKGTFGLDTDKKLKNDIILSFGYVSDKFYQALFDGLGIAK
ncbi:MAG: hypothetical protein VX642_09420 [Bdellovibrionota bacterium]|nr:hypothetical protein [Bdellovibrionota bacterium]